jgi:predicted lipid-binding transport protein (Tim44 family)
MQNFDILTIVFLGLAIFVIIKLRSVLGQRTGHERPRDLFPPRQAENPPSAAPDNASNVIPMPHVQRETAAPADPAARLAGIAAPDSPAHRGLSEIMAQDPSFDPAEFVGGAKAAYEMIVLAFARGDRKTLKDLLSKDVFEDFDQAVSERESRGESAETTFVSMDKAEILAAELRGKLGMITVKFSPKLISCVRDKAGKVVDGSAETVVDLSETWTFSRQLGSRDPAWTLVATEADA